MEYKVGDEVIAKVRISEVYEKNNYPYEAVNVSHRNKARSIALRESDIIQKPGMTAEEAWEIAKKLKQMNEDELLEVFRTNVEHLVLKDFSPQQAKAKIEAWEAEKEIKVGDVVRVTLGKLDEGETDTALITWVHENNWYDLIMKNGLGWTYVNGERIKKTGRHIDIDGILKQIGGDE